MFKSLDRLGKHMEEEHPNSTCWGDSIVGGIEGIIISQKCFLCGKELVETKEEKDD